MVNEAVILAGGFGTRLKNVIADIPKPMALINGKPFLEYLLRYLEKNGISRIILSVGYKAEYIINYFGDRYRTIDLIYAIENDPLKTGGGIKNSVIRANNEDILIVNGDTFFNINIQDFFAFHRKKMAVLSVALRTMADGSRYGSIHIDNNNRITGFHEKKENSKNVLINCGTYILSKRSFLDKPFPSRFSFEKEYLEAEFKNSSFFGKEYQGYFIDIGIPSTYEQAQTDFLKDFLL